MNLNKYLIAAMLGAGLIGTASAQYTRAHSFNNQQEYQVLEEGAGSSADFQTKQMIATLGLNAVQAEKIREINLSYAEEIQRAKADCADDIAGFNEYVDRVASVRENDLRNVLTDEQFALYCDKSNDTWLGMDKFKLKADDLKAKGNKEELKIKGKSAEASEDLSASGNVSAREGEFSDAYRNSNNIIEIPSVSAPDFHNIPREDGNSWGNEGLNTGAPQIKTYPGGIQTGKEYPVNKESENRYSPASGRVYGMKPDAISAGAGLGKPKSPGTNNSNENTFSSGQTLEPSPDSDDFFDTRVDASARSNEARKRELDAEQSYQRSLRDSDPSLRTNQTGKRSPGASENYFINEDSKAKFNQNEIKIKPEEDVKYKYTDKEIKIKDANDKVKLKENEEKYKIGDSKVKVSDQESKSKDKSDGSKIKSNGLETKIKSDDLKIKIKE